VDTNNSTPTEQLSAAILAVTLQLLAKSPAVYLLLSETPLFQATGTPGILPADYRQYLETLRIQLRTMESTAP
jgi:hypothetical protein